MRLSLKFFIPACLFVILIAGVRLGTTSLAEPTAITKNWQGVGIGVILVLSTMGIIFHVCEGFVIRKTGITLPPKKRDVNALREKINRLCETLEQGRAERVTAIFTWRYLKQEDELYKLLNSCFTLGILPLGDYTGFINRLRQPGLP